MLRALVLAAVFVAVLSGPLANLRADVERWQHDQAARLTCHYRAVEALTSEDEEQIDAAEAFCERVD